MSLTSAIKLVSQGAPSTVPNANSAATNPARKLDAKGNPIDDDDPLAATGTTSNKSTIPTKITKTQAENDAAAAKAVKASTTVPATETTQKPISAGDIIAADANAKATDAKAAADQANTINNSSWNNVGAQGSTNPSFNSSNDRVLAMGGEALRKELSSRPENLLGGFTAPEPASGGGNTPDQQAGLGATPGGGFGAPGVPGGTFVNSFNSNSGNTAVDSFNNGNVIGNGFGSSTPIVPEIITPPIVDLRSGEIVKARESGDESS